MENVEVHGLESTGKQSRLPVQLSLKWGETPDAVDHPGEAIPGKDASGAGEARNMQLQNELIEAQAGLTKTVFLTLLGIGLLALHFY